MNYKTTIAHSLYLTPLLALALAGCGSKQSSNDTPPSDSTIKQSASAPVAKQPEPSLSSLAPPYNEADYANGKKKFAQCVACHSLEDGRAGLGPDLFAIVGRTAGAATGYAYSAKLKDSNIIWDAKNLDSWIKNPTIFVPGSKMNYAGMRKESDRRDLIAYLLVATSK